MTTDITTKVSIAQGSFYTFFPSKAMLYFIVLEREEQFVRNELLNMNTRKNETAKQYVVRVLNEMISHIETNPLLRELLIGENVQRILRDLPDDIVSEHIEKEEVTLLPLIEHWQKNGVHFREKPPVIAAFLRSLFSLSIQREMIGKEHYPYTLALIIESVTDRIIEGVPS